MEEKELNHLMKRSFNINILLNNKLDQNKKCNNVKYLKSPYLVSLKKGKMY